MSVRLAGTSTQRGCPTVKCDLTNCTPKGNTFTCPKECKTSNFRVYENNDI